MQTHTPAPIPSAPHAPSSSPTTNEVLTAFFDSSEPIAQIADQLRMSVEQLADSLSNHARLIKRLTKVVELRARFKMFTAELVAVDTLKFIAEFDRDPERRRKASTKILCHVAKYRLPPRRKPLKPSKPPQAPSRVRADILRSTCGSATPAPATSPSAATPLSAPSPSATPLSAPLPHHDPMRETESPLQEAIRLESASTPQPATPDASADPIPTDTALLEPAPTEPAPTEPAPTEPATSAAPDESPFFAHDSASSSDPSPPHHTARSHHLSDETADVVPSLSHAAPTLAPPEPGIPIWPLRPPLHTCR